MDCHYLISFIIILCQQNYSSYRFSCIESIKLKFLTYVSAKFILYNTSIKFSFTQDDFNIAVKYNNYLFRKMFEELIKLYID